MKGCTCHFPEVAGIPFYIQGLLCLLKIHSPYCSVTIYYQIIMVTRLCYTHLHKTLACYDQLAINCINLANWGIVTFGYMQSG